MHCPLVMFSAKIRVKNFLTIFYTFSICHLGRNWSNIKIFLLRWSDPSFSLICFDLLQSDQVSVCLFFVPFFATWLFFEVISKEPSLNSIPIPNLKRGGQHNDQKMNYSNNYWYKSGKTTHTHSSFITCFFTHPTFFTKLAWKSGFCFVTWSRAAL